MWFRIIGWRVLGLGFFFKHFWLRLRGQYHKFGYAAVSFGHPLSLTEFAKDREGDVTKPLGRELMRRIEAVVPVLPVPMVASIIEAAEKPISRAALEAQFATWVVKLETPSVEFSGMPLTSILRSNDAAKYEMKLASMGCSYRHTAWASPDANPTTNWMSVVMLEMSKSMSTGDGVDCLEMNV